MAKTLLIALIMFFLKHFLQATIEWTDIIPVRPKAYIWGMTDRAIYVFIWQFIYTFWVYFLSVIIFYFILQFSFLKNKKTVFLISILALLTFMFLLYVHDFEFPYEKLYFPSGERINYALIEEFILYSCIGFVLIYLIRKWFLQKTSGNNKLYNPF